MEKMMRQLRRKLLIRGTGSILGYCCVEHGIQPLQCTYTLINENETSRDNAHELAGLATDSNSTGNCRPTYTWTNKFLYGCKRFRYHKVVLGLGVDF